MPASGDNAWFANSGTLGIDGMGSGSFGTTLYVGALKGVEMSPSFEHAELYGMERLERRAVAKHTLKVKVSCKYAMWDAMTDAMLAYIMTGGASTSTAWTTGTDATVGMNSAANKNTAALFSITAVVYSADRLQHFTLKAHEVYFEGVPYALTENEFITRDLSGTASYITIIPSTA